MSDEIEGTADEVGSEIIHASHAPVLAVTPQVKASELVERLSVIREAMDTAMKKDIDYGLVPGTDKPTLFKPGAEKLSVLFQLDLQVTNAKSWGPGDHLTVESKATAFHAPSGQRLGSGEGMCTTKEKKYAVRKQERTCPSCGVAAVIKGKKEYGGGWLCWKKRDGCGAKFHDGDPAIESQPVGEIENPELPDLWNTVVKMAQKRARVDAVLAVTGASALFTQDVEDGPLEAPSEPLQDAPNWAPTERDIKHDPEKSDLPVEDVWWTKTYAQIKESAPGDQLRAFLVDDLKVPVPPHVGSWKKLLTALPADKRAGLTLWLQDRVDAKADVPWPSPEGPSAADQLALEDAAKS